MDNIKKEHLKARRLGPLCFSLNSLVGSTKGSRSPTQQNATLPTTNSLNRRLKRKAEDRNSLCRSWGPVEDDGNKDFWASIQEPYNFIMDSRLVPDAYETNEKSEFPASSEMELSWDMDDVSPSYAWDFSQFLDQYNELYEWLIQVQVELYNPSTFNDKIARVAHQEELKRQAYRKKLFIVQGTQVMRRFPENKEEISWRVNYLTNKWEQLETAFTPKGRKKEIPVELDLEHEEKVLKNWLSTMEGQIQPITCRLPKGCSIQTLQERYKDNQILLKDIAAHGPVLKDVIRQYESRAEKNSDCQPLPPSEPSASAGQETQKLVPVEQQPVVVSRQEKKRIPRRVRCLDKRWHQIYLGSLEWHYYLEGVIANFKNYPVSCSSDSEDEPVTKCRKLSFNSSVSSGASAPRAAKGWSDYENHGSETGSYIEYVDEGITGAKSLVKDDYVAASNSQQQSPQFLVTPDSESLCLEPMKVLNAETEQLLLNNLTAGQGMVTDDKDRVNCTEKATFPKLTQVEKTSPNCGIFEYKHHECDSVKDAEVAPITPPKLHYWNNLRHVDDNYIDEDAVEKDLQRIIDESTPLDTDDWLNSNIPTDSENSISSRHDNSEERMDTNGEAVAGKIPGDVVNTCSSIKKLIKGAEKLVREDEGGVSRSNLKPLLLYNPNDSKRQRIRNWVSQQPNSVSATSFHDSCDASGELTTGESDVESNTSEQACWSFSRNHLSTSSVSSSFDKTPTAENSRIFSSSTPKQVPLRGMKRRQDQRPWSITDVALIPAHNQKQLEFLKRSIGDKKYEEMIRVQISSKNFSSSESALNHMKGSSSDTAVEGRTPTNASYEPICVSLEEHVLAPLKSDSSPTAEEGKVSSQSVMSGDAEISNNRSITITSRRRKMRSRRKSNVSAGRRTVGSESDGSSKRFSGRVEEIVETQQFRLSSEVHSLTNYSPIKRSSVINESNSIVKNFDHLEVPSRQVPTRCQVRTPTSDLDPGTAPEDAASLSEQAWDPYQDTKYLSEPYSEDVDHEAARKLLEFGDDYRKYIDSDGSSLISRPTRPARGKKLKPHGSAWSTSELDSDSDLDSIHQMLNESKTQLHQSEIAFRRCCNDTTLSVELQVVIATANNHLEGLKKFISDLQKEKIGLETENKEAQEIVRRWETLKAEATERQRQLVILLQLQKQMKTFKVSLEEISDQCDCSVRLSSLDTPVEFKQKIQIANEFLAAIAERREFLTALNLSIHTFMSEPNQVQNITSLKDDLADLYQFWDETQLRINGKIAKLEGAEAIWRMWEEQKKDLQKLLQQDSDTLKVLNKAMQTGDMTDLMESNAQDVARLLNEKRNIGLSARNITQVTNINSKASVDTTKLRSRMGESDSGTSGYESCSSDDLSERERRLARLRRLARDLEATVVPGSKAYSEISETIADAEKQLSALQKQCRELLVRSTVASDDNKISHPQVENLSGLTARSPRSRRIMRSSKENNWIWRIVRTAIPLQAALLLLLCVACLLEPDCCDSANTLNFNLSPQLRFINGPPPV